MPTQVVILVLASHGLLDTLPPQSSGKRPLPLCGSSVQTSPAPCRRSRSNVNKTNDNITAETSNDGYSKLAADASDVVMSRYNKWFTSPWIRMACTP